MRYAPEHNEATRERILEAASRLFREHGIAAVGLAKIMAEADLTVGTFYTHFKSKEALLRETLLRSLQARHEELEQALREGDLEMAVRAYLSPEHRDAPGTGCPVAALASEVARHPRATRHTFASHNEPTPRCARSVAVVTARQGGGPRRRGGLPGAPRRYAAARTRDPGPRRIRRHPRGWCSRRAPAREREVERIRCGRSSARTTRSQHGNLSGQGPTPRPGVAGPAALRLPEPRGPEGAGRRPRRARLREHRPAAPTSPGRNIGLRSSGGCPDQDRFRPVLRRPDEGSRLCCRVQGGRARSTRSTPNPRADQARERSGLTKADVARRIDAKPEIVRRLLTEAGSNPTMTTVLKVAAAVGCHLELVPNSSRNSTEAGGAQGGIRLSGSPSRSADAAAASQLARLRAMSARDRILLALRLSRRFHPRRPD